MAVPPKKEQAVLGKELTKLQTNLGGARDMKGLPQALRHRHQARGERHQGGSAPEHPLSSL